MLNESVNMAAWRLLDLHEMASLLSVSPKTLYYWVSRREVPFTKVGRHIRFNPREVLDFYHNKTLELQPCSLNELSVKGKLLLPRSLKIRSVKPASSPMKGG